MKCPKCHKETLESVGSQSGEDSMMREIDVEYYECNSCGYQEEL